MGAAMIGDKSPHIHYALGANAPAMVQGANKVREGMFTPVPDAGWMCGITSFGRASSLVLGTLRESGQQMG